MTGNPRPRVSVVVPVRNGADFVVDAVASALGQEAVDVEVVVVENGSTDDTATRVASIGDPRVRLLRQEPAGVSRARNLGIRESRGDWVAFLDADDLWRTDKLTRQLAAAGGASLVFTDARLIQDDGTVSATFFGFNPPPPAREAMLPELLARPNFIPLSSVMVRKVAVSGASGFREDLTHSEDWDLWVRLALASIPWTYLAEPLVTYRVHGLGASRDHRAIYRGEVASLLPLLPELERLGLGPAAHRRLHRAEHLSIVYGRRSDAPPRERLRDLATLIRNRPSWRASLAQVAYTAAPGFVVRRSTPPVQRRRSARNAR